MHERVLILVKTYPIPSKTYIENVCTAGIKEDGKWVRIYPVPFRTLRGNKQYQKYQWIECELSKRERSKDCRPESMHLDNLDFTLGEILDRKNNWAARRKAILDKARIYTNKAELLAASSSMKASLAIFKPSKIIKFEVTTADSKWDPETEAKAQRQLAQGSLFETNLWRKYFKLVKKIPYKFHYTFTDDEGVQSRLQITDWEIGALYLNYAQKKGNDIAVEKIKEKYFGEFLKPDKDLYFYLGTSYVNHMKNSPNPWLIIGVAPFPKVIQMEFPELL